MDDTADDIAQPGLTGAAKWAGREWADRLKEPVHRRALWIVILSAAKNPVGASPWRAAVNIPMDFSLRSE